MNAAPRINDDRDARQRAPDMVGGQRLRCLATLDEPPGVQHLDVRRPPKGLRGWLARTEEKLARKVRPEIQQLSHVRGARVAVDYLLQALLTQSSCAEFAFVVPAFRRDQFERWMKEYRQLGGKQHVAIHSIAELSERGMDTIAPDLWLNLQGNSDPMFRVRDQMASKVFPTITVQHGLSRYSLLYDVFFKAMVTPTYACDSLVCTSRACKIAVGAIFERLSATFNECAHNTMKFEGRLDVIPLCVDTDQFKPRNKEIMRKQFGLSNDALVLFYVGYLSQVKADLAPILFVVQQLVRENANVKLKLVVGGTGPEAYVSELRAIVSERGLANTVVFVRDPSDADKQALLAAADIFVGPCDSMQESFGLTPVEAMASGLPQVVADWSGYRETVVDGETGFLIPTVWGRCDADLRVTSDLLGWTYDHIIQGQTVVLDLACLRDRLQRLIRDPERRAEMSRRSRARAEAEFSLAAVCRRYEDLWAELSQCASGLKARPRRSSFNQPAYFDFFGHFASEKLRDDSIVRRGDGDWLCVERLIHKVRAELPGLPTFDERLLDRLLGEISMSGGSSDLTVGELVSRASSETTIPDVVRRHVLFLLKHGKLSLVR